jgi:hypothetical protein
MGPRRPNITSIKKRRRHEAMQQKATKEMQHPIYFENIQIKHLQHTFKNS